MFGAGEGSCHLEYKLCLFVFMIKLDTKKVLVIVYVLFLS